MLWFHNAPTHPLRQFSILSAMRLPATNLPRSGLACLRAHSAMPLIPSVHRVTTGRCTTSGHLTLLVLPSSQVRRPTGDESELSVSRPRRVVPSAVSTSLVRSPVTLPGGGRAEEVVGTVRLSAFNARAQVGRHAACAWGHTCGLAKGLVRRVVGRPMRRAWPWTAELVSPWAAVGCTGGRWGSGAAGMEWTSGGGGKGQGCLDWKWKEMHGPGPVRKHVGGCLCAVRFCSTTARLCFRPVQVAKRRVAKAGLPPPHSPRTLIFPAHIADQDRTLCTTTLSCHQPGAAHNFRKQHHPHRAPLPPVRRVRRHPAAGGRRRIPPGAGPARQQGGPGDGGAGGGAPVPGGCVARWCAVRV